MSEEMLNLNEGQENVVGSQPIEQNIEVDSEHSEVATEQPTEKPVQTQDENAKFKEQRLKYENEMQKAIDAQYEKLFGQEYGIKTKAEYDKLVSEYEAQQRQQEYIDKGIDPEDIKSLLEDLKKDDPDFQELSRLRKEANANKAIADFSAEFPDAGVTSLDDLDKLPNIDKVTEYVSRGMSLNEAYKLANYNDLVSGKTKSAEQETIAKMNANREATPGSLSDSGKTAQLYTKEQVDSMSQDDIYKNYDLVMKSMKTWR